MRIALAQPQMLSIEKHLLDDSHPASSNHGKHWIAKQVAETFRPSAEPLSAVREWLLAEGIASDRAVQSRSYGWLHVNITVKEAESLLETRCCACFHESGTLQVGCDANHVPEHVSQHVDFIVPTIHFDARVRSGESLGHETSKRDYPGAGKNIADQEDLYHQQSKEQNYRSPGSARSWKTVANILCLIACGSYVRYPVHHRTKSSIAMAPWHIRHRYMSNPTSTSSSRTTRLHNKIERQVWCQLMVGRLSRVSRASHTMEIPIWTCSTQWRYLIPSRFPCTKLATLTCPGLLI